MSMVTAVLLLLLFGLDLATGIPFNQAHMVMDIVFVVCAIGLGYVSWTTFNEVK